MSVTQTYTEVRMYQGLVNDLVTKVREAEWAENDITSVAIRSIVSTFNQRVPAEIADEWGSALKNRIVEVLSDEGGIIRHPMLGKPDGLLYDKKELALFYHHIFLTKGELGQHSPFGTPNLTVKEHPLAGACAQWLEQYAPDLIPEDENLNRQYELLQLSGMLFPLPQEGNADIRERLYRQACEIRNIGLQINAVEAEIAQMPRRITELVTSFEEIPSNMEALLARQQELLDEVDASREEVVADVEDLRNANNTLSSGTSSVVTQVNLIRTDIQEVREGTEQIQQAIRQTQKDIDDLERKKRIQQLQAALWVAGMLTGTFAAHYYGVNGPWDL